MRGKLDNGKFSLLFRCCVVSFPSRFLCQVRQPEFETDGGHISPPNSLFARLTPRFAHI